MQNGMSEEFKGCHDGDCLLSDYQPGGMHTNDRCHCLDELSHNIRRRVQKVIREERAEIGRLRGLALDELTRDAQKYDMGY